MTDVEESLPSTRPRLIQWSEDLIEDNGGTILAIAGSDYCILASDTRLSANYQIRSRNVTRIMKVCRVPFKTSREARHRYHETLT
jgi:20S proteasome alpha/beta subunit